MISMKLTIMLTHYFYKAQTLLLINSKIFAKYFNFFNILSLDFTKKLLKYTRLKIFFSIYEMINDYFTT